jgi:hypothetical protein
MFNPGQSRKQGRNDKKLSQEIQCEMSDLIPFFTILEKKNSNWPKFNF